MEDLNCHEIQEFHFPSLLSRGIRKYPVSIVYTNWQICRTKKHIRYLGEQFKKDGVSVSRFTGFV